MAILDYDGTDGSVGEAFTARDRLAFDVYKRATESLRFQITGAGPMLDQEQALAQVAKSYQIVDAFLTYRRDKG